MLLCGVLCRIHYHYPCRGSQGYLEDAPATAGDNSAALQAAIDKESGTGRERIVFVPAGRYTMTRSVFLWPGVRLIGYGATRPVFVLPPNTPGFQKGMGVMVMFQLTMAN